MAKEQNDFRAAENVEPYWTNSLWGMPTYQLGAIIPYDYIGAIDDALRFLPRPADYLFYTFWVLWFIISFKTDPLKAFFWCFSF
jgi:hypothetical protein